jgi:hypothetical protein
MRKCRVWFHSVAFVSVRGPHASWHATCRSVDETEHEVLLQDGAGVACTSSLVLPALLQQTADSRQHAHEPQRQDDVGQAIVIQGAGFRQLAHISDAQWASSPTCATQLTQRAFHISERRCL